MWLAIPEYYSTIKLMREYHSLTWASRKELDIELQVLEGSLPLDLSGHVFMNSPVGTVNSEGTPLPKTLPDGSHNPEWGNMIFNGDGMLFRFDLDKAGVVGVKSRILRTPDYWADWATRYGTDYWNQGFRFDNWGMARMGLPIGTRNQINTSVNLFRVPGNESIRLTANFDAGRPFEIDPVTLEVLRPLGSNADWRGEFPGGMNQVFPLHQSSAHPSYDPFTREFWTVNFRKDAATLAFSKVFKPHLTARQDWLTHEIEALTKVLGRRKVKGRQFLTLMELFVEHLETKHREGHHRPFVPPKVLENQDWLGMENEVRLLRWNEDGPMDSWNLLDPDTGKNLVIEQTMHQTALSRNWIVLVDSSLKFALDVLENNPFPEHPWLNRLLRRLVARTIQPITPLYLVSRKDLVRGTTEVMTRKVWVPLETAHFSVDYDDSDDLVTVYTSHNAAMCVAEWVRPYDTLAVDGSPVPENVIGLLTAGEMDVGRTGIFKIDASKGKIRQQKIVWKTGNEKPVPGAPPGLHTWATGLTTYRGSNDAESLPAKIPTLFWQFYGLDRRFLTHFIEELYSNYKNRKISVSKLKKLTAQGVPFCLVRQDTATQELVDGWVFQMNENFRSLQFVPRKRASDAFLANPELDGYILCTMINGSLDLSAEEYTREIWIFDAAKLHEGPVVKLGHPDLSFAFTIHSVWAPRLDTAPRLPRYDVRADYQSVLEAMTDPEKKRELSEFMEREVYPHYEQS